MVHTEVKPAQVNLSYAYRPAAVGAAWEFRIDDDALFWDNGRRSGRIAYRDVTRVRMIYRPATMQGHRFVTEVWAPGAPKLAIASTSWRSLVEQQRLDKSYSSFISELHRRIAHSGSAAVFETGNHPLRYWTGIVVFIAVAIGMAAMTVQALQLASWGGAALVGAFLSIFLWQAGNYFRRNRPGRYDPILPPTVLLP